MNNQEKSDALIEMNKDSKEQNVLNNLDYKESIIAKIRRNALLSLTCFIFGLVFIIMFAFIWFSYQHYWIKIALLVFGILLFIIGFATNLFNIFWILTTNWEVKIVESFEVLWFLISFFLGTFGTFSFTIWCLKHIRKVK